MRRGWKLCRAAEPDRGPGTAILLILMFATMVLITRLFCADADGYSSFWPANSAMVGALLTLRARYAIPVLIACFCLNLILNGLSFLSSQESILASVLNVVQAMLVAVLARRFCGALTDLTRFRRFAMFALIACAGTALEAAIGVGFETAFLDEGGSPLREWLQWTFCDVLGLLLAMPAVMLVIRHVGGKWRITRASIEPLILLALAVAVTVASFLWAHSPFFLLIFPVMVTLAFRAGPIWVLTSVLVVSIFVSAMTAHDLGPIALLSPDGRLMRENMLQPYLLSLLLSALPASNALGEKLRVARRLTRMKANIEYAASHDPLTGLMNRQLFKKHLGSHLRSGEAGLLLFIDLDHFKQVNDTHGHQAGDEVLSIFGRRMMERAHCLHGKAARFGGDEFAMLIPGYHAVADIEEVCLSVLRDARMPYHLGDLIVLISGSIGAASLRGGHDEQDEFLRSVDLALYAAKDAGRDDYRLFGDHPHQPGVAPARPGTRQVAIEIG